MLRQPVFWLVLAICFAFLGPSLRAEDILEIDKAFLGTTDSWRDVSQFLRDQIERGSLSIRISQPFKEVGGDPAPGEVKTLLIDYHLNGRPYRLFLKEQFPVAFKVDLPSSQAVAPGQNPLAEGVLENVASSVKRGTQLRPAGTALTYVSICISTAALVFSALALKQARQTKKTLRAFDK